MAQLGRRGKKGKKKGLRWTMRCASFASVCANASFGGVARTPFMVKRSVANAAPAEAIWRMPAPAEAAWAVARQSIWRRECLAFTNVAW